MMKKIVIALLLILMLFSVWFSYHAYRGYKLYKSIFRLTKSEIINNLNKTTPECRRIQDCKLKPGDILIRRYITNTTKDFDKYFDPFFTHSAFYLGNKIIFEATGDNKSLDEQIRTVNIQDTDWYKENIENFVVIRPKNYFGSLDKISKELEKVAGESGYLFGFYDEEKKEASCSDIILKKLLDNEVLPKSIPFIKMVTPDYLFWSINQNISDFQVIGYSFN